MNYLRELIKRHNLVLEKGNTLHKLLQLLGNIIHLVIQLCINHFLYGKLLRYKRKHNITKPIVHYYAVCWNEEKILPFMLDYYEQFVDRFFIYDNYSTDDTESLLSKHENVKIIRFKSDNRFNDVIHSKIKSNCWKRSRGKADFVIVCDVDEFLYHPQITQFLTKCQKERYSFFIPKGYNMYSATFPEYNSKILLTDTVQNGIFDKMFCKSILFDPYRIVEINYAPGAHVCFPIGVVRKKNETDLLLLHYKNLSIEYVMNRTTMYRERLSQVNLEKKFGVEYLSEDRAIRENFNQNLKRAHSIF